MNIVLCGFMGCGKSTIGKIIASHLKMKFIDMDSYIEKKENRSIKEIFSKYGEDYFRDIEHKACLELAECDGAVIAAGGGAMTFSRNVDAFNGRATIIFINIAFNTIYKRIGNDKNRPLMDSGARELYNKRIPLYKAASDKVITVYGDISAQSVADNIIKYYINED